MIRQSLRMGIHNLRNLDHYVIVATISGFEI